MHYPKYFDKIVPFHLKSLRYKKYKSLIFAERYLESMGHRTTCYSDNIIMSRIKFLIKQGVPKRWKICNHDWYILMHWLR